jgi:hypothetical protein
MTSFLAARHRQPYYFMFADEDRTNLALLPALYRALELKIKTLNSALLSCFLQASWNPL